jgi:hypothetical protein
MNNIAAQLLECTCVAYSEALRCARELAEQSPIRVESLVGGKSGLHRTRCQVTPGGRKPTESAAESRPPHQVTAVTGCGKGERVR